MVFPFFVGRRQGLAVDHGDHLIDARFDAAVVVPQFEVRGYRLGNDAVGDGVGQRTLETIAHLDAHAPVVLGDDQVGPIVHPLAAQLPCVLDADAELLDVLGLRGGQHQHRDLTALLGLQVRELGLDSGDGLAGQCAREVGDPRSERRHGNLRLTQTRREQQGQPRPHATDAAREGHGGAGIERS